MKRELSFHPRPGHLLYGSSDLFPRLRDDVRSELAHLFALPEILHLAVDEVTETFQVQRFFSPRAHQDIPPHAACSDRVVNQQLHRSLESADLLVQMVGTRIDGIGPSHSNSKPPAKCLKDNELNNVGQTKWVSLLGHRVATALDGCHRFARFHQE